MTTIANSLALVCSSGLRPRLVHSPLTWFIMTRGAPATTLPCRHRSRHTEPTPMQQLLPQQQQLSMHLSTLLVRDLQSRRCQLAGPGIFAALLVLAIITASYSLAFYLAVGPDLKYTTTTTTTSTILLQPTLLQPPSPATFAPASLTPAYSLIRFHPG
jgi:hypothetical protein